MGAGGRNKFLSVKKQENTFTHISESKSWWNKDSGFIRVIIRIYINDKNEDDDEGSKNSSILTQVDDFLCSLSVSCCRRPSSDGTTNTAFIKHPTVSSLNINQCFPGTSRSCVCVILLGQTHTLYSSSWGGVRHEQDYSGVIKKYDRQLLWQIFMKDYCAASYRICQCKFINPTKPETL